MRPPSVAELGVNDSLMSWTSDRAWIGALLNTWQLEDKLWFGALLVGGLLGLGVVAMIAYSLATGTALASLLFALGFGVGWFGLLIPAIAALVASFAVLIARGQQGGAERPRWPWERDVEV